MRFSLIDQIVSVSPGDELTAVKNVSLSEEYLADHFPRFPVLPGVLMLEAMTQASAWLIRISEDFAHSVVLLKEARNVKYNDFVAPGRTLTVTSRLRREEGRETRFDVQGWVENKPTVSARLILERYNLADASPEAAASDQYIKRELRNMLANLWPAARVRPVGYSLSKDARANHQSETNAVGR
jgi:3-hydroxyacyl-[acyl-carrier-protein] dehydratase